MRHPPLPPLLLLLLPAVVPAAAFAPPPPPGWRRRTADAAAAAAAAAAAPRSSPLPRALRSAVSEEREAQSSSSASSASSPPSSAAAASASAASAAAAAVLSAVSSSVPSSIAWGDLYGLPGPEATFHALFSGMRGGATLGLSGSPFVLRAEEVMDAVMDAAGGAAMEPLEGFFAYDDLVRAVREDFLDADRGSTDNTRGWKVAAVSKPRGDSFEDARMTKEEVDAALEKGTVILSAAGAHIPKLAGATLACTDASSLPCALNVYVTAAGMRTSAPPHTDRQDVIVVQTEGRKRWRVYGPPDPSSDPEADMFARGKGDDALPLFALEDGRLGCELLLDATLEPGDVLFVPAAFPHTTDTADPPSGAGAETTSVHLTFNFDTHVWDLDYLSARRLALRRAGVRDAALGQEGEDDNRYVGVANELPADVRTELFRALPLGLLDDDDDDGGIGGGGEAMIGPIAAELERISRAVDRDTASRVPPEIWAETVRALRRQGTELMDVHRDMYLAAVEEGRTRRAEEEMTAHLTGEALARARAMTPERMRRLSVFRVRDYFSRINGAKEALADWSRAGSMEAASGETGGAGGGAPPEDWEFSSPLRVGDEVEADLGGAFFPATVTKAVAAADGGEKRYDVRFFDGDVMDGLPRGSIKLLNPPSVSVGGGEEEPPPGLTKKELKRWRKKQEKKAANGS